jgi:glycosyltransferase involved in cell wall biosynthesis
MTDPKVSIIVPGHNASATVEQCLSSLSAQVYPIDSLEIIYVDDASTDGSAALASRWTSRIITLLGLPHGPAAARNAGVAQATGEIIVFIDADVVAPPGTIRALVDVLKNSETPDAVFGSYDSEPFEKNFASQYRNLLHHFVHQTSRRDANTFWAGCGAIRRRSFERVGGFDAGRYSRPLIEDIELGHRMRALGMHIVLDPSITVKHLKMWSLCRMVRSDIFHRAIPWMRLLLQDSRNANEIGDLNLRVTSFISVIFAWTAIVLLILSFWHSWLLYAVLLVLCLGWAINIPLCCFFTRTRGFLFALMSAPLQFIYHLCNGLSVAIAVLYRFLIDSPLPGLYLLGKKTQLCYWRFCNRWRQGNSPHLHNK